MRVFTEILLFLRDNNKLFAIVWKTLAKRKILDIYFLFATTCIQNPFLEIKIFVIHFNSIKKYIFIPITEEEE